MSIHIHCVLLSFPNPPGSPLSWLCCVDVLLLCVVLDLGITHLLSVGGEENCHSQWGLAQPSSPVWGESITVNILVSPQVPCCVCCEKPEVWRGTPFFPPIQA